MLEPSNATLFSINGYVTDVSHGTNSNGNNPYSRITVVSQDDSDPTGFAQIVVMSWHATNAQIKNLLPTLEDAIQAGCPKKAIFAASVDRMCDRLFVCLHPPWTSAFIRLSHIAMSTYRALWWTTSTTTRPRPLCGTMASATSSRALTKRRPR